MELDRANCNGGGCHRYGVLGSLDVHMVRDRNMGIVIAILVIAVILWWPRKEDR